MIAQLSAYFTGIIGLVAAGIALTLGLGLTVQTARLARAHDKTVSMKEEARQQQAVLSAQIALSQTVQQRWKDEAATRSKEALLNASKATALTKELYALRKIAGEHGAKMAADVAKILEAPKAGASCEAGLEELKLLKKEAGK